MEDEEIRIRGNRLVEGLQTLPPRPELKKENEADYFRMKDKSGRGSVEVSEEFQSLYSASNFKQTQQGTDRLSYKDSRGNTKNLSSAGKKCFRQSRLSARQILGG